jgi:cullin-associated NEDD8-dissociated protein 1
MMAIDSGLLKGDLKMKATIAKSVKYSGQKLSSQGIQTEFYKIVANNLISLARESDPEVKKNALEGLTTIVHQNWTIVADQLQDLSKFAFTETAIRKELIEEVDIGPFTQKYDKGIPIRRAAFQLLQTLFEVGATSADGILGLVDVIVKSGLVDTAEEVVVLNL